MRGWDRCCRPTCSQVPSWEAKWQIHSTTCTTHRFSWVRVDCACAILFLFSYQDLYTFFIFSIGFRCGPVLELFHAPFRIRLWPGLRHRFWSYFSMFWCTKSKNVSTCTSRNSKIFQRCLYFHEFFHSSVGKRWLWQDHRCTFWFYR